ncbi:hypothetical protein JTE90_000794 [Oedothorax gibbosus]|uniref:Probable RNA polymerase II nuclear localization protein SLC7A6OS n=1 Tax=Oedothorax gibbosus TaxID=931172 RepID=A0AAV6U2I0_9ARAC|nr:hypothetical protein JTE90_000794 [Oedothorax gibbosus]
MSAVLRFKRKACDEPAEGLVVVSKKSKCELSNTNEVYFKFAATLKSESSSFKDQLQAALLKDNSSRFCAWRHPAQRSARQVCGKVRSQLKGASEKKRLDLLNNRRLILKDTLPIEKEGCDDESAEVRKLFQLYDIIEENEEVKKQNEEMVSTITCNGEPLIREKQPEYVFDVYIADVLIDQSFVENTVSVRPCSLTNEDIYSGDSSEGEPYEDEDDSNDENNWRNEYPEDEDSQQGSEDDSYDAYDCNYGVARLNKLQLSDDDDEYDESYEKSRILKALDDNSAEED